MNYNLKRLLLKPFDLLYKISPELTLKTLFKLKTGITLNLEEPKLYNEKLQWLKLYYKDERIPLCVDKYEVRQYIENKGLNKVLTKIYWEGFNPNDIPFDNLPDKFVIKVTHGQGFNIICTDKDKVDYVEVIKKLERWLEAKFLPSYGEWFYGIVKPRIIIEEFLGNEVDEVPKDYKIFCFNGEPKYIAVDNDRFGNHTRNIYDTDWNFLEGFEISFKNGKKDKKPDVLKELIKYAEIISNNFPHVRVDFYILDNEIKFGEMTFMNGAGFDKIAPEKFHKELGNHIELPSK